MKDLPNKPSEILELALQDLDLCELDPDYKINMGQWHTGGEICQVCLAGSILAKTIGVPKNISFDPKGFSPSIRCKMDFLEYVRLGYIGKAYNHLQRKRPVGVFSEVSVTYYHTDPIKFKTDLRNLISHLKEHGE